MNYIGKFITNFREFYNEINSATLTGAIDVVVIRQEDGSYHCSPFHVRFGKIGVLRSREKVVDIEINGEPIGIQMKLGESGEAFFVEELPEDHDELIPNYLATSPIPPLTDIGAELEKMKMEVELEEMIKRNHISSEGDRDSTLLIKNVECVIVQSQDGNEKLRTSSVMAITDFVPIQNNKSIDLEDSEYSKDTVSIDITGETQLEASVCEVNLIGHVTSDKDDIVEKSDVLADEAKVKRKRRKKSMIKRRPRNRDGEAQTVLERDRSDSRDSGSTDQDRPVIIKPDKKTFDSDDIFHMEDDDVHFMSRPLHRRSGSSSDITISRSISLPLSASLPRDVLYFARRTKKLSATFAGDFHPFSDGDVTPISSPKGSRPPSPKSDSEFERQKSDATSQTDPGEISWDWGELPIVPKNSSSIIEWNKGSAIEQIEDRKMKNDDEVDKRSMLGGMLNFMRTTKKMRHMPESEGIFLDELNPDELDPEVAALYFPKFRSQYSRPLYSKDLLKDEDTESGHGPSLPHSPHSVEGAIGSLCLDSDTEERHTVFDFCSKHYTDLEISLCGGLQEYDADIPHERFLQFVITYDDLCENPAILQDQNLVIRMGGKFYNWQTAGPMLLSLALFQRPLSEKTVDQLVTNCMPKKKKKSYSWWSWRRPAAESDLKKDSTEVMSDQEHSGKSESSSPLMTGPLETVQISIPVSSPNISIPISSDSISTETTLVEARSIIGTDSDTELIELSRHCGYKKSLVLSSEQIEQLQLKEGANDAMFSVTTAYQGTTRCKCYIYLWNYDDKVIISDIDGTITKSDVLGHILPIIGQDWAQSGVAQLFTKIKSNGYQFLYLSARAIGQARATKDYLRSVRQGELCLPDGPLLLSPTSLFSALHREVIEKKPEEFKISCLKNIQALFPNHIVGNPFYAGFGNKINDTWAYRSVEIPLTRIFTINHRGELKLELIQTFQSSYTRLSDVVDHVFPPLQRRKSVNGQLSTNFVAPDHFSSFTYWRFPLPSVTPTGSYQKSSPLTVSKT